MNLTELTITQALGKLKSGEITAIQLTNAYLDNITKLNPELNAYITITRERALADATASDARYANGNPLPLDGIPIAIKDNFATRGIKSTGGSRILENFIPEYESTVSQKLADAGCVLLGKTNMDEFAMSGDGTTSYFGATKNPHDFTLTPGGSSSGSAAAVAGGLALCATGTDTGDSIRVPASWTKLVGFKPTYGACSRFGVFAFASSLDTVGPIARNVSDCELMFNAMVGFDVKDSTSCNLQPATRNIKRVGIITELNSDIIMPEIRAKFDKTIAELKNSGYEIVKLSVPHIMMTRTLYNVISRAESSSNLSRYDGMRYGLRIDGVDLDDTYKKTRAAGFGANVKKRLMTGVITLTKNFYETTFVTAMKVRKILDNEFNAAFAQCDLILTPGGVCDAPKLGDDLSEEQNELSSAIYVSANMTGCPAIYVSGVQIIGNRFDDLSVLKLAKEIEEIKR